MSAILRSLPMLAFAGLLLISTPRLFAGPLHERWDDQMQISLADGSMLQVRESGSQRRWFGLRHGMGFGGGHLKVKLEFSRTGEKFVWEGGWIPILLQFDHAIPLLVVFDRESEDSQKYCFRYFRRQEDSWQQLPITQFPRSLAHQNLWLSHHYGWVDNVELDEYDIVKRHDPKDTHFQRCLMTRLWFCIATGKTYGESERTDITAEFLQKFKASMRQ